jgi:allantoin racemase
MRRVLIINPNTNPAVTQRVREVAQRYSSASVNFEVVNPSDGPFSIETESDKFEAQEHALRLIRDSAQSDYAAYVMACFDDLALNEARVIVSVPVVGTCEAGIDAALAISNQFAVITTVHDAVEGIRTLMRRYGAGPQATVRAAGIGVADAASGQDEIRMQFVKTVHDAIREDGAQAILLASGGLTGQAPAISKASGIPVVDGVEEAIRRSLALIEKANYLKA